MKLLSSFLVIFAFLAVSGCTGSDTVRVETQVYCPTLERVLMENEDCPKPDTDTSTQPPPSQDQEPDPTPSDCNLFATGTTSYSGSDGNDRICGNEKNNIIRGGKGDDTLYGRAGTDTLFGEAGRDTLKGEGGNDNLIGGNDDDTLDGGEGSDTADYNQDGGTMGVEVDLVGGEAVDSYGYADTLIGIENVTGTTLADDIKGDGGNNVIDGNGASDGDDKLDGRGGTDTIVFEGVTGAVTFDLSASQDATTTDPNIKNFENIRGKGDLPLTLTGDDGNNTITGIDALTGEADPTGDVLNGKAGDDILKGLKANDTLNGGPGNDKLYGGIGDDTLNGGDGTDTLMGGAGVDCFIITLPTGDDDPFSANTDLTPASSSDSKDSERKAVISATKDTIQDYGDDDKIAIVNAVGTDTIIYQTGETPTSKSDAAVKSVILRKGFIDIITTAYRAAEGSDTPDDETDDVRAITQQKETLVTVTGLTETRFDSVAIGSDCE